MLDAVLLVLAILSSVFQLVVSTVIIYYKIKSKQLGLKMVTNYWFDYLPHVLFGFSLLFIIYSLTHFDTSVLGIIIALTGAFIFNMEILLYNRDYIYLITFPFKKEKFNSIRKQDKLYVIEGAKSQKILNFPKSKTKKLTLLLK